MGVDPAALRRCQVAVDLGASRTRIYLKNQGLVVDEPSLAAVDTRNGALVAVGSIAERMVGRSPSHIRVARPISNGMVVDTELAQSMLRQLADGRMAPMWRRAGGVRGVVGVPFDSGSLTRKAAVLALNGLGVRRVELVDIPVAAAIGCGLPVDLPEAAMLVVCGAGITQIAVLALGAVVAASMVPVGGDAIDYAIAEHLRSRYGLMVPIVAVRELYQRLDVDEVIPVRGQDVGSGLARLRSVDSDGVRDVVCKPLAGLVDAIAGVLRRSPPDLVVDLADRGITLAGGGATVPGLEAMVRAATGMPVHVAPDPHTRVIDGLALLMDSRPVQQLTPEPVPTETPAEEEPATDPEAFAPVA